MNAISKMLLGGPLDLDVLRNAERSTLILIDNPCRQYSSFALRLLAATVIATAGVAADSATTIIGAMLVAPLMSPMLGTALATALGRPLAAIRALLITVAGMCLVVLVSAALTAVIPVAADMETNSQVLARVSPRLVDLIIALASGFVAALASVRSDIPDAVPGIAISASIVPPLCVVGAALYEGAPDAALGAFLLFITNYVAIQITGAAVFLLMGLGARQFSSVGEQARKLWYVLVGIAAAVVLALLLNTSLSVVRTSEYERLIQDVTASWLSDTSYRVKSLDYDDAGNLYVQIVGTGVRPSVQRLNKDLLAADVTCASVSLSVVNEVRVTN